MTTASPAAESPAAVLGTAIASSAPTTLPAIGAPFSGGVYAGIIRGVDGAADMRLVLLDAEAVGVTWQAAVEFAKLAGGELPTRREQALLFANLQDQFQPRWYWSGEQYAPSPSNAWNQYFDDGYQLNHATSYAGRARAVRRLKIQ